MNAELREQPVNAELREQWDRLVPMMESGMIDPPIGRVYPVEEAAEALAEMDARRTLGKSVLTF